MVNAEILEGLRRAVIRGETLKDAMMTFYSSGYPRQEIMDAAAALQAEQHGMQQPQQMWNQNMQNQQQSMNQQMPTSQQTPQNQQQTQNMNQQTPMTQPQMNTPQNQQHPMAMQTHPTQNQIPQKVSSYQPQKKSKNTVVVIILVVILLLLIGTLISTFIFKDQIIDIFRTLFSE